MKKDELNSIVKDVLSEALETKKLTPAPDPKHKIKEKPYDHYKVSTDENKADKKLYRIRFNDNQHEFVELTKEEYTDLERIAPAGFMKGIVVADEKPEGAKSTTLAKLKKMAEEMQSGPTVPRRTPEEMRLKENIKKHVRSILREAEEDEGNIPSGEDITGDESLKELVEMYSMSEILDKMVVLYTNMGEGEVAKRAKAYAKNFRKFLGPDDGM